MAGPGALLLLGGLLGGLPQIPQSRGAPTGGPGGSETPPELEEEAWQLRRWQPQPPRCFTRTLQELLCLWDSPEPAQPWRYRLQYRLEQDPWQECPLSAAALSPIRGSQGSPGSPRGSQGSQGSPRGSQGSQGSPRGSQGSQGSPRGSRSLFWCSLPAAATVTFVPLELRVLRGRAPGNTHGPPEGPPETSGTPEGPPETTGTPETPEEPPKTTGTPETPPENTHGHPEGTPKASETPEGTPKTSETPEGTPKTTGTPEGTPKTTGTPEGTPKTTGTPEGPPKTSETPERPPETTGTTGTPEGPPKTSETPEGPPKTTERPPEIIGTPEGTPKTSGTPEGPPKTSGTPEGIPKTTGTPERPPETTGTPETPEGPPETSERPPKTTERPPEITGSPEGPPKTSGTTGTPPKTSETPETPPETPLFQRTIYIDQLVLPGPPQNVSVSAGGGRGELCVRWAPPPGPYLHSSLVFELALSPPRGPPKTVGVPAGRREQGVGGLSPSTPYSVRARARPDGLSYGGVWSPWSAPVSATTAPELDAVTLGLSCLLVLLVLGLGALGLLGHRRTLRAKLWPPVPGPEREFEGLFSNYGGNFQLWLCQGPGSPCAPPCAPSPPPELEDAVEEVGGGGAAQGGGGASQAPPPSPATPPPCSETPPQGPAPPSGPSPSPSFEYTLFEPGSALLCPSPRQPGPAPYANLAPPTKGAEPKWAGHAPHYVICS